MMRTRVLIAAGKRITSALLDVADVPFRTERHPEKSGDPAATIRKLVRQWGKRAYDINDGECAEFADAFVAQLGGSVWSTNPDTGMFSHDFVEYRGKFYDAENPTGVNEWYELKLFRRQTSDVTDLVEVTAQARRKGSAWRKL